MKLLKLTAISYDNVQTIWVNPVQITHLTQVSKTDPGQGTIVFLASEERGITVKEPILTVAGMVDGL